MSLDGFIDDQSRERLMLSGPEDWSAIDALRAEADAILVGAGTIRADNPKLLIRDPRLVQTRIESGRTPHPAKVTLTRGGDLDPAANFFQLGQQEKIVYCAGGRAETQRALLGTSATVVGLDGERVELSVLLEDLAGRGIERLLVEGGTSLNTQLLGHDLVDELRIAIAPQIVAESEAPRLIHTDGPVPHFNQQLRLFAVEQLGECAVLHYRRPVTA